ncbi:MAG: molybdopterin-binding protein [Candidatus Korarchaeota archaeon]
MGHKKEEVAKELRLSFIVVSDSIVPESDLSTPLVAEFCMRASWHFVDGKIVPNSRNAIINAFESLLKKSDIILVSGGSGPSPKDITVDVLLPRFSKTYPGIGEYFRKRSFEEIGPIATLSRACAGSVDDVAVFIIPGSPSAVKIALEILKDVAPHWVAQLKS